MRAPSGIARGTLAHALESMDAATRLVLVLLHVEKLTIEEIAETLGLDCADVARTAERARIALSTRLKERSRDGDDGRHEGRAA
jgi:DNA-directed RNA polymerase specialized sigma24 family protein